MPVAKTAVSLPEDLLEQVDALAANRGLSRSALVQVALNAYLTALREADLRERIAQGYAEEETADERDTREALGRASRRALRHDPW